jgi:hypothetical protein
MLMNTRPKKKDQMSTGCVSSRWVMSFAREIIAAAMPPRSTTKKFPFTCCQNGAKAFFPKHLKGFYIDVVYGFEINSS